MCKRAVLLTVVIILVVVGLLPVLVMFAKTAVRDGQVSLASYKGLFRSGRQWVLLWRTFTLSSLTTLLATGIGLPLGILLARTDLPMRRAFAFLFVIPLLVPPYVTAVSWFHILGREGFLSRLLGPRVAARTSGWLFGLPGCVLVLFSTFLPIVMLLTITYLKTINPHLEEAGRLVGRWPRVLRQITVRLIMPGVLLGAMLVFLLAMGEFAVPSFLRYDVFPVESFTQFSAFYNFEAATAATIPLGLMTLTLLIFERIFLRGKTYQLRPAGTDDQCPPVPLGSGRPWLFAIVSVLSLLIVVLPLLALVIESFSLSAFREAFSRAGDSLVRSLTYAAIGASLLAVVGFLCGYLIHTRSLPLWRGVDSLTIFLFALPSTVIGIGLATLWNRPSTNLIYATPVIIIFGYLAQYTALTSRITLSSLAQIPPSMEEAAQTAGAAWLRRTGFIIGPLAKRGLIAGWIVGFIFCLRDTGISMMVYPPGHDTFPVRIFTLMANGSPSLIAALCVILVTATLLPLGILEFAFRQIRSHK